MSDRSPQKASFAATTTGRAASVARSFCRRACTPVDEDRDHAGEIRPLVSCCRNLSYLVHCRMLLPPLGRFAERGSLILGEMRSPNRVRRVLVNRCHVGLTTAP